MAVAVIPAAAFPVLVLAVVLPVVMFSSVMLTVIAIIAPPSSSLCLGGKYNAP